MRNGSCPRRLDELGPWQRAPDLDRWREDRTCSFCGGLDPIEALTRIGAGAEVVPTDKSYKMYLRAFGGSQQKVYFQHFGEGQQDALLELLNAKKITFAAPGGFYVLPFFLARKGAIP